MSEMVFTFPGKAGDAIMQFPVAYQWSKATGKKFDCWMDELSTKIVAPLFAAQPCVDNVEFKRGVLHYQCGGQPWHFAMKTSEYVGRTVIHLGLRSFPIRQITMETIERCKLPIEIDRDALSNEPSIFAPADKANRLVMHGQPLCVHSRQSPGFWKFVSGVKDELEQIFDEIVFVGSNKDLDIAKSIYGDGAKYSFFDDGGSLLKTAEKISGARAVIACGSVVAALGGAMKIPTIRVHDQIGTHSKTIWNNLGDNQVNDTEYELRKSWPEFRDKWLTNG